MVSALYNNAKQNSIMNDLSWATRMKVFKKYQMTPPPYRRVGIAFQIEEGGDIRSPQDPSTYNVQDETPNTEDSTMKIKLFRLMYETIRDSDLKVRRAEMIKTAFNNDTAFDIGFLFGDVTDKINIMTDISMTLKKLYKEWRPLEHINAYEQIANKAIEINHLTDVVRVIHKKAYVPNLTTNTLSTDSLRTNVAVEE